MSDWIVTGADAGHFVNSKMLVASWFDTNRTLPLAYCDFGLTAEQAREVQSWPVKFLPRKVAVNAIGDFSHAWRAKAGLYHYIKALNATNLVWIDADAILLQPLGDIQQLMSGYDLLIDAHRMSLGEIIRPETRPLLPHLDLRDAYFSSGFWVTSSMELLRQWDAICAKVVGVGNLWENDAFSAAVYATKARIRTVTGNIWHVRGMTSLDTVEEANGTLVHQGIPCMVLHANAGYTVRGDGRRVFDRAVLSGIQDRWEQRFDELRARGFRF